MNKAMTQLDDFKRVLGLDENYQEETAAPQPQKERAVKKEKQDATRRTVSIPGDLHTRICLLGLWMNNAGIQDNPRMYEIIDALLEDYMEHHPEAAKFVKKA